MNGLISLVAGNIIPLNDSAITALIESPGMKLFSLLLLPVITLLIGLVSGYYLQKRSFDMQAQIDDKNKRTAAYSELLKDISLSQSTGVEPSDTSFHMFQAYLHGSQEVRSEMNHLSMAEHSNPKPSLWLRMASLQAIMIHELMEKQQKPKSNWQFWKRGERYE